MTRSLDSLTGSESHELYGPFVRDDSEAIATGRSLKDETIRTRFLLAR
jgi:hypothetical protein